VLFFVLSEFTQSAQQTIKVTGKILDESSEPIIGATKSMYGTVPQLNITSIIL